MKIIMIIITIFLASIMNKISWYEAALWLVEFLGKLAEHRARSYVCGGDPSVIEVQATNIRNSWCGHSSRWSDLVILTDQIFKVS